MKYKRAKAFGHQTPRATTERYKDRYPVKEKTDEEKAEEKLNLDNLSPKVKVEAQHDIKLTERDYGKHMKAKAIMSATIGKASNLLHKEKINDVECRQMIEDSVKKAIREVGVFRAMRAWGDLIQILEKLKDGKAKGVPLRHDMMLSFWHEQFGWQTGRASGGKHARESKPSVGSSKKQSTVDSSRGKQTRVDDPASRKQPSSKVVDAKAMARTPRKKVGATE